MAHAIIPGQVTGLKRLGLLPAEASSFVGRASELAGIAALLRTARMVTVTGPAGVGKTRIALQAAAQAEEQYPDGIFVADLGQTSDAALIVGAVAAAIGLPAGERAARDDEPVRDEAVLDHLRGQRLLLILDTCEHLVDACAAFADAVLRAAPGVTLLATSRQPLDAQGEYAFPLLPLPAEDAGANLFAARAAAVVPGFALTPQNRADVVRLCQRLDGLPLAIELAAVRLRALPLTELASQLESGIRTLTVSRRGTSPRHQTLRAAVDWSYQLCTPAERLLWQRLSVFAQTFDVTGAEQVCAGGALPQEQVLHALVGLVDKSVVLRDGAESSRYRLPAPLREFGADQLAETDDGEQVLARLAQWSLDLARDFDERFRRAQPARAGDGAGAGGGRSAAAFRRLHREYENIRTALGYALGPQEQLDSVPGGPADARPGPPPAVPDARRRIGADLAVLLTAYWRISGRLDESRQWLGQVISLFPESSRDRVWALRSRGLLAAVAGDPTSAVADISESIRLAEAAGRGAEPAAARGYLNLNLALILADRPAEALSAAETARQRLTACGLRAGLASLEAQLGYLHQLSGDIDEAVACCDRGLALLAEPAPGGQPVPAAPDREGWLSGYLQLISGLALVQRPGSEQACGSALRRALAAKYELGDVIGTAYAVEALAWLAARREQYERAGWLLGAADRLWTRAGRRLGSTATLEETRQRTVRATRRALGERRYAAAYAHGGALGLDAVVRDAADDTGEPPAGPGGGSAPDASGCATAALTRREREIAELVASGLSNREIAARLFISKRTVDAHVDHIFSKLELSSRVQLTVLLREPGRRTHVPGMRAPVSAG